MLRQLIALGAISVDAEHFNTLKLEPLAKTFLKGERQVLLRESVVEPPRRSRDERGAKPGTKLRSTANATALDAAANERFNALKAWRAEVARAHALPAYVIFHDATLIAMATAAPQTLDELSGISGIGSKKLDAYGQEVLRLLRNNAGLELLAA